MHAQALSQSNCMRDPSVAPLLTTGALSLRIADGWAGAPDAAPYDAIHVGAAAEEIPEALVAQLKRGGRMVLPVGPAHLYGSQVLVVVDKDAAGRIAKRVVTGV